MTLIIKKQKLGIFYPFSFSLLFETFNYGHCKAQLSNPRTLAKNDGCRKK